MVCDFLVFSYNLNKENGVCLRMCVCVFMYGLVGGDDVWGRANEDVTLCMNAILPCTEILCQFFLWGDGAFC